MASNLSSIGFRFADAQAFQSSMLRLAGQTIERLDCEAGEYAIWRSQTGAEVWFHLPLFGTEDQAVDIQGLTPWFEGESETALEVRRRIVRADDNAFEGALEAWVGAREVSGNGGDDGGHPIVFDAVDFAVHAARELPFRCTAKLVGFARRLEAFVDEAAFREARHGREAGVALAGQSFISVGMFGAVARGDDSVATADALLTGRVVEHHRLVNEASGQPFHRLPIAGLSGDLDIVADPDAVRGDIVREGTVEVACRLFGRLVD